MFAERELSISESGVFGPCAVDPLIAALIVVRSWGAVQMDFAPMEVELNVTRTIRFANVLWEEPEEVTRAWDTPKLHIEQVHIVFVPCAGRRRCLRGIPPANLFEDFASS